MNFKNKRYITKGVSNNISLLLQLFMWECIDSLTVPKDYLQVFKLSVAEGKQKIEHSQEDSEYKREYLLQMLPFLLAKDL